MIPKPNIQLARANIQVRRVQSLKYNLLEEIQGFLESFPTEGIFEIVGLEKQSRIFEVWN